MRGSATLARKLHPDMQHRADNIDKSSQACRGITRWWELCCAAHPRPVLCLCRKRRGAGCSMAQQAPERITVNSSILWARALACAVGQVGRNLCKEGSLVSQVLPQKKTLLQDRAPLSLVYSALLLLHL